MIASFRKFCRSLPAHRREAPCPFCFGKGIDAPLVEMSAAGGFDQLRCAACKRVFALRHALDLCEPAC